MITLELVRDTYKAWYSPERLALLYDKPMTVLEVLTRVDGPWAEVPAEDRLWTVLRNELIDAKTLRLFACQVAENALNTLPPDKVDSRSREAIRVSRLFADGLATREELAAEWSEAWSAAYSAAESAAYSAAVLAAVLAAYSAADSAESAAVLAADSAELAAADLLVEMLSH